ncbi:sulfatase-like hydrolase/transferase [Paenibacillus sp. IB182496]|uniref:Sulfatase-like hydrolase/transferase n=1 Tax=Paenibacillus sabuli TaxID=2772509 RepID=A0A927BPL9_9BACL|nr:sulfatase-like hydrolase/transferase [Paenibacillus sabuli]MBD2844391.1 sulfatase-like hydrolase/transferase [Paenibacillus sabuli]
MVKKKPNIVFITTDQQRADTLQMKQCGIEVTPNLNELAKESCVFSRAYTSTPLCVPARTALATGKYPTRTGVVLNGREDNPGEDHKPIHQMLSEAGYSVGHFGMNHIRVQPELNERVSFERYIDQRDYTDYVACGGAAVREHPRGKTKVEELCGGVYKERQYSSAHAHVWEHPLTLFRDVYYTDEAVRFVDESAARADQPFALFVNLWAPHPPLAVPEPYHSLFDPDALELPANVGAVAAGEPANRRRGAAARLAEGISPPQWRQTWAAHLGLTRLADDCIGRLLAALKRAGIYDDTMLLFMSDHGELLGQHNMYQKMEMYEPAVKVPMLIKAPSCPPRTVDELVSHLDIVPTILDWLGRPEMLPEEEADGISLLPVLRGEAPLPERSMFSQYSGNQRIGDIRRAVITKQFKYIFDPRDEEELYDLSQDPLEMTNVARLEAYAPRRQQLKEQLLAWSASRGDWIRRDE